MLDVFCKFIFHLVTRKYFHFISLSAYMNCNSNTISVNCNAPFTNSLGTMYQSREIVAIIVLLNLFQLHNVNAAIKSFNQSYFYPQKQVMYNNYGMKEDIFVYAVCNADDSITEKTCTIIQRQFPYDKVTHSCNITLRMKHPENFNLVARIWVHVFRQENAILFWDEMGPNPKFNLMTMHLNDCNTSVLELDDLNISNYFQQIDTHKILTYDSYYEIFIEGLKFQNQSTGNLVGMRINVDGKSEPIYNITKNVKNDYVKFISPIATRSPDKGYIYCTTGRNSTDTLIMVKPDGTEKLLMTDEGHSMKISSNYDIITSCVKSKIYSVFRCIQFNENGEVLFNVTIGRNDKYAHETITVHTTPHGGFLFVTIAHQTFEGRVNYEKIIHFDVVRVDNKGIKVGNIQLKKIVEEHYNIKILSVWKNGDEYCITLVSQTSMLEDNLQIIANCFNENDFLG